MLPFTVEQFLGVFERYNLATWPAQVAAYALGLAAVALALRSGRAAGRAVAVLLAAGWLWTGAACHLIFFREITPAAVGFGLLFIVQGLLFLGAGVIGSRLVFGARTGPYAAVGGLFVIYAMLLYPAIAPLLGHGFPRTPAFGVTPCPLTIVTFGLLLLTSARVPRWLLVIQALWSLVGFGAALTLGIGEDAGRLVAGVVGTALLLWRDRRASPRPGWRARPV
jgi:hypothetical protein